MIPSDHQVDDRLKAACQFLYELSPDSDFTRLSAPWGMVVLVRDKKLEACLDRWCDDHDEDVCAEHRREHQCEAEDP